MKRFYIKNMLTALLLLCSTVASAQDFEVDGIYYDITDATAKTVQVVSGGDNSKYSGNVVIPDKVTYNGTSYSVTSIGSNAFNGCTGLTSITIPNSVTSIGRYAFENCSGLTSIEIPGSVTSIEEGAFGGCKGLASITIPNSVTSIGWYAFSDCSGLTRVTIGNSVKSIGWYAFNRCFGLKTVINLSSLTFSKGSTDYGYVAYYAENVINGTFEGDFVFDIIDGVNTLCGYVGAGSDVTLPETYNGESYVIGVDAFKDNTAITSVTIGNSVTGIGSSAFNGCSSLASITIPNGVTSIGSSAFENCSGLTSVTIPNSVTSIEGWAFNGCTGLTSIVVDAGNGVYDSREGCNAIIKTATNTLIAGCKNSIIPNSVTGIGEYAFENCSGLTSIVIPNSVTSIGGSAFRGCSGLKTVINLSLLTFSKGSTDYGYVAYYAEKVTNAPYGSIEGDFVFGIIDGVNALCGYVGAGGDVTLPESYYGDNYVIAADVFKNNTAITSVTIPDGVTSIGNTAFYACTGLTSVKLGKNVTSLGDYAFQYCTSLSDITLPSSLQTIGKASLSHCGFTNVVIPDNVKTIGDYAFDYCENLVQITIGNSVTSIGFRAFNGCSSLKTVINLSSLTFSKGSTDYGYVAYYADKVTNATNGSVEGDFVFDIIDGVNTLCGYVGAGGDVTLPENYNGESYVIGADVFKNNTAITSVTIGKSVTRIGSNAFEGCSGLTSITIPNSVTAIGYHALENCSGLTSIEIPGSVTSIEEGAFGGCKGLASITIPNSVTGIGKYAFSDCSGLTRVTIGNSVKSIGKYAFNGCSSLKTVINLSSLTFSNGSTDYGYVAYYAENVINGPFEGDFVFGIIDGVNTLCGYVGAGGDVTLPENYNGESYVIGADVFKNNTAITSVTIGNSVTRIGSNAFNGCSSLASITIPNGVTSIGSSAFEDCSGLTSIEIPNSITCIGDNAFEGCTGLTSIVVDSGNGVYDSREGCNAIIETATNTLIAGCKNSIIPNSVTGIGEYAFENCSGLTSIVIPSSVTSIGGSAFRGCSGLTSVTIPNSVTSIGSGAFNGCTGLTNVTIPNSVTSIGEGAFENCASLTSVTIGNSVTSIGDNAFYGCSGLKTVINLSLLTFSKGSTDYGYVAYYANDVINAPNATNGSIEGDFAFAIIDGTNTLIVYIGAGGDITLPENYNGESYVIGSNVFRNNTAITSVTIPGSVTSIGSGAFNGCSGLTSVTIPNSVTSIGDNAFEACSGLTSITIPNSVTGIGDSAFSGCTGLASVTIGNSVTGIGDSAFNGCTGLTSVTIPDGVTSIGNTAFYGCTSLTSVKLGKNVTSLGDYAFQYCTSLSDITLPSSLQTIGKASLSHCGFTNVVIPDNVKTIGDYAFDYCENLAQITIGNSVTSIGDNAFTGCDIAKTIWLTNTPPSGYLNAEGKINYVANNQYSSLSNVVVYPYLSSLFEVDGIKYVPVSPAERTCDAIDCTYDTAVETINIAKTVSYKNIVMNVKDVKPYICFGNSNIKTLNISNGGSIDESAFNNCINLTSVTIGNSVTSIGSSAFEGCGGLISIVIPNSVTSIGGSAFENCSGLTSVKIPNSVTSIGERAFSDCSGLTSIEIPGSVTSIEDNAFENCSGLTSIEIPGSVTSIGSSAFSGCSGLTSVTIGNSVTSIGHEAFYGCSGLTAVHISDLAEWCKIDFYNSPSNPLCYAQNLYLNGEKVTDLVIPSGITDIKQHAFYGCSGLTSVTIGNSVTSIGDYAFYGCSGLTSVTIPNSVTGIGSYAFSGCSGLASVTIPNRVTSIGSYAFNYCTGLTSVTIPNSVTSIERYAFYGCSSLTSVTIPNSVTRIEWCAFEGCSSLTSVTIGNSVTSIGSSAFSGCTGLTSITIPNSVTSIGNHAFENCSGLTSVTIGDGVTSIGFRAFNGCSSLKTVINLSSLTFSKGSTDYGYVAYYADKVTNATNGSIEGDFVFGIINGVNTLCRYIGAGGDVTLPENYNGESYVIGADVFKNNTAISGITIPNSVTSIGDNAFYGCSGLTGITIPNSVTSIEEGAFENCASLTSVTIGNSVTSIGDNAFYGCSGLKTVINLSLLTFSKGSTDYGYVAHYADKVINEPNCSAKGDFVFYSKKDSIFRYTTAHGLPGTVVGSNHIWESPVINRSTNGVRITVFATNVSDSYNEYPIVALGELEFYDGNGKKINYTARDVTTNSLERTEGSLAGLCDGDYSTFYHSTWLSGTVPDDYVYLDIKFPQTVDAFKIKMVGRNAQRCVPTEIGVTITGGTSNKYYTTAHGLPGTVVGSNHIWESPVINGSTNGVRITAFATNVSDSYNEYPIVALGELEFYDGNGKKINYTEWDVTTNSLEITEGSLAGLCDGDYSTYYHSTWLSGTIPDDYVYLDIKFPQTVDAFKIKMVGRNTQRCVPTEIGVTITGGTRNTLVAYTGNDTAIALPENFNGENYVVSARAFEEYSALSEIKIPQAVASIGNYAFKGCSSLANVIIENREVALSLGSNGSSPLFADCPLDSVYIGGKINYNTSSSYGYSPFYRNSSLRSVVITDVEEQVYDNEFYGCSELKNVQIGNGVKSIGKWAFSGCSSLDYLIVGANVSSIGQEAFSDCTNVTTIYSYATVPPVCGTQALEDINKWNCTLLVPKESITKYQSAEQWKDFFFISEIPAESLPGDVNSDGRVSVADITTVVDAILNESTDTAYDVNGDSRVSVADITTIVDIILNEGASAASKASARVATRSSSNLSLYIDPFEINAGEEKEILVNLSNAGTEITAVEFDLFLPEGLEVVSDEYGYYILPGSRTPNKRNPHAVSGDLLSSGAIHVICYHNSQLAFTGEDGDVLAITIKAADDLEPGNYTIDLRNIELVNPADPTNGILISDNNTVVTDIENIEAEEGATEIYDLNGRKVAEPVKGGIYIINGKKVVVNK